MKNLLNISYKIDLSQINEIVEDYEGNNTMFIRAHGETPIVVPLSNFSGTKAINTPILDRLFDLEIGNFAKTQYSKQIFNLANIKSVSTFSENDKPVGFVEFKDGSLQEITSPVYKNEPNNLECLELLYQDIESLVSRTTYNDFAEYKQSSNIGFTLFVTIPNFVNEDTKSHIEYVFKSLVSRTNGVVKLKFNEQPTNEQTTQSQPQ